MELTANWSRKLTDDGRAIREAVFLDEQQFSYEFDDTDDIAYHLVVYLGSKPAAVARIFEKENGVWAIGRVAVSKEYRGMKIGNFIVKATKEQIIKLGGKRAYLGAQKRVQQFYEKNGYTVCGNDYYDEYCLHVPMEKQL